MARSRPADRVLRAAGYVRISKETEETTSPETQMTAIAAHCKEMGWTYDPDTDLFQDIGKSGSKRKTVRPGYDRLMASLDRYDRIVVWKMDRLTRRLAELAPVIEQLEELGAAIVAVSDKIDTSRAGDRLLAELIGTVAGSEARTTAQRVRDGQATMAKSGRWKGGGHPYGWKPVRRKDGPGTRLVLAAGESEVLRFAVAEVTAGRSVSATARLMNEKGYRSQKGNPWSPQALKKILTSPVLLGHHEHNGMVTRDENGSPLVAHQALITEPQWDRLQRALSQRRVIRPHGEGALLSGLAYCGVCGGRMHGSSSKTNPRANYKCRNRYALNKDTCTGTSIKALPVDELVGATVTRILSKKRNLKKATAGLVRQSGQAADDAARLRDEIATARRQMQRLKDERLRGIWGTDDELAEWEEFFGTYRERLVRAEGQLAELNQQPPEVLGLPDWMRGADIEGGWERSTTEQQRAVIRLLIKRIDILPTNDDWHHRELDERRVRVKFVGEE